jgi:protease-4
MKVNLLLNELSKGMWAMSLEGMMFWAPIANKIRMREELNFDFKPGALLTVFDKNRRIVQPDEDGNYNVPKGSIGVVNMVGVLVKHGDICMHGADDIVRALDFIESNPNFKAGVVYMDGPGGAVTAISPFVAFGLRRKKVYVGLYEQCCSAHLYAMYSFTDYVMAENDLSANIGSLGITISLLDDSEYLAKMGIKRHDIYPEESKDKNLAFRLALEGKYEMITTEMMAPLAIKFQNVARAKRPKLKEAPGVLTGKTFYTDKAIEYGLTDSQGSLADAMDRAEMLSEMKSLYK